MTTGRACRKRTCLDLAGSRAVRGAPTDRPGRRRGAGLGLAIVKSFVELHGGHVRIEAAAAKGTTVICFFPAEPVAVAEPGGGVGVAQAILRRTSPTSLQPGNLALTSPWRYGQAMSCSSKVIRAGKTTLARALIRTLPPILHSKCRALRSLWSRLTSCAFRSGISTCTGSPQPKSWKNLGSTRPFRARCS